MEKKRDTLFMGEALKSKVPSSIGYPTFLESLDNWGGIELIRPRDSHNLSLKWDSPVNERARGLTDWLNGSGGTS
jgi:hypothetical protein